MAAAAFTATLGGCCAPVPAPERYFHRETPIGTATFFRYAVETKQYEAAYACLAPATQKRMTLARFRSFLRWWRFAEWDDLSVRDFIIEGRQFLEREPAGGVASIIHVYSSPAGDWWEERFMLVRIGEDWRIDLAQSTRLEL